MLSASPDGAPWCWVVTDGRAGIEAQALGLAEAMARKISLRIERKRISVRAPYDRLPRTLWGDPFSRLEPAGDALRPPFPDIWIACGRRSTPLTIAVKARHPATFTIQIQDPRAPLSLFDLVIPPEHDGLAGDNVFPIVGSPNRSTPRKRAQESTEQDRIKNVVALIGGPNRAFQFGRKDAAALGERLKALVSSGAALHVTTSRRTPPDAALAMKEALGNAAQMFFQAGVDDAGVNPYPAMLVDADAILVTEDSVNMAVEAAAMGKPVHILRLARKPFASAKKFDAFHESLKARGAARDFNGRLAEWKYEALNETARAADEAIRRWRAFSSQRRVR